MEKGFLSKAYEKCGLRSPAAEQGKPLPGTGECYGSKAIAKATNELYSGKITTDEWLDKVGAEFNRILAD
jgi:hypothetical protein